MRRPELVASLSVLLYIVFFALSPPPFVRSVLANPVGMAAAVGGAIYVTLYKSKVVGGLLLVALVLSMSRGGREGFNTARGRFVINAENPDAAVFWNPVGTQDLYVIDGRGDNCNNCGEWVCGPDVPVKIPWATLSTMLPEKGTFRCNMAFGPAPPTTGSGTSTTSGSGAGSGTSTSTPTMSSLLPQCPGGQVRIPEADNECAVPGSTAAPSSQPTCPSGSTWNGRECRDNTSGAFVFPDCPVGGYSLLGTKCWGKCPGDTGSFNIGKTCPPATTPPPPATTPPPPATTPPPPPSSTPTPSSSGAGAGSGTSATSVNPIMSCNLENYSNFKRSGPQDFAPF